MSYGCCEQVKSFFNEIVFLRQDKPWYRKSKSGYSSNVKKYTHRAERRRAKHKPECQPLYKRYNGWEY